MKTTTTARHTAGGEFSIRYDSSGCDKRRKNDQEQIAAVAVMTAVLSSKETKLFERFQNCASQTRRSTL